MATTTSTLGYFSKDYATARERYRRMSERAAASLDVLELDAKGPDREALSIDIAWLGPPNARRVLLHSSGLHGVEGFAGSAIQLQLLESLPHCPPDTAIVLAHILNPYGMAWLRRANESNVDLNRNFLPDGNYAGAPPIYAAANAFLNPPTPPSRDFYLAKALALVARHGMTAAKQAVAGGQYEFPQGLFFGGKRLEQGPQKYLRFLTNRLAPAERIRAIDVHTGLGRHAEDVVLAEPESHVEASRLFGDRVPPLDPRLNPAYRARGGLGPAVVHAAPRADTLFVTQEFGTCNPIKALHALREENRWAHYGGGAFHHPTRIALKEAFCPDDEAWRAAVLRRGRAVIDRALEDLAG